MTDIKDLNLYSIIKYALETYGKRAVITMVWKWTRSYDGWSAPTKKAEPDLWESDFGGLPYPLKLELPAPEKGFILEHVEPASVGAKYGHVERKTFEAIDGAMKAAFEMGYHDHKRYPLDILDPSGDFKYRQMDMEAYWDEMGWKKLE